MDSHSTELRELEDKVEKLRDILSNNGENWRPRIEAMTTLIEVVNKGNLTINNFTHHFGNALWTIADALVTQLGDLRSEITSTASQTICFLAETFGSRFSRAAGKMMPGMIQLSGSTNGLIRGHVKECMTAIFMHTHSKAILTHVLEELKSTKSKYIREACSDFVLMILETWPLQKYKAFSQQLEDVIVQGLKARTPETRETSARCVSFFLGHFPERRDYLFVTLDTRARRLVDRILEAEDPEAEDEYYNDIRKSLASRENDMKHMDLSRVNRRPSSTRNNSSRGSLLTPKSNNSSRRSYSSPMSPDASQIPLNANTRAVSMPPQSSNRTPVRRNTVSSARHQAAHDLDKGERDFMYGDKNMRPSSTNVRSNLARATSFDDSHRPVIAGRPRPHTTSSRMTPDEKNRLLSLYNEHQNYLARSAVNLKDLHSLLTTGRLKQPLDTYLSNTINHIDTQLEMAQRLKTLFQAYQADRPTQSFLLEE